MAQIRNIGDTVTIKYVGAVYSTYKGMFIKMGFRDTISNDKCRPGDTGTIFAIEQHEDEEDKDTTLFGVDFGTHQALVNEGAFHEEWQSDNLNNLTGTEWQKRKIGDIVTIQNTLKKYINYAGMFEKMGFRDKTLNDICNIGDTGTIFAIEQHETDEFVTLFGIDFGTHQLLVNEGAFHEEWHLNNNY